MTVMSLGSCPRVLPEVPDCLSFPCLCVHTRCNHVLGEPGMKLCSCEPCRPSVPQLSIDSQIFGELAAVYQTRSVSQPG